MITKRTPPERFQTNEIPISPMAGLLRVEPVTIIFPSTHVSSFSRYTIQIYNDSDTTICSHSSPQEEQRICDSCGLDDQEQRGKSESLPEFASSVFMFDHTCGCI